MAPNLPNNPALDRFRREARRLQRSVRGGDPEALAQVSRHHPDGTPADAPSFPLTAAQHVVARTVGFSSWPRLQAYLRTAERLRRDPTVVTALCGALQDRNADVRCEAILALAKSCSGAKQAIEPLEAMGRLDRDPRVRSYAAKALKSLSL